MADLCTLADVRLFMETTTNDTDLDTLITALLPLATERIQEEVQRELVPTATATRTFSSRGRIFDFGRWDLRTATTVTYDPYGDAPKVLVAETDYRLLPRSPRWNTYTRLQLSAYFARATQTLAKYGETEISIAGAWGMATVPEIAKNAAIRSIQSWLDKSAVRQAYVDGEIGGLTPVPGTFALPPAARMMLQPLKRFSVV